MTYTPNALGKVRGVNPFAVIEKLLTLAALTVVAVTVGSQLAPILGLDGRLGTIAAWFIALVFDALWIGALKLSEQAIRQRSVLGMAVMLSVAAASMAGSVVILLLMGHARVFALVPVAAAVFMGLRIFADHMLADDATSRVIAEQSAAARNTLALTYADARQLKAGAENEVVIETAETLAQAHRQAVQAKALTGMQKKINKARATAEEKLTASEKKHGVKAEAFAARALDVLPAPAGLPLGIESPAPADSEGGPDLPVVPAPYTPAATPQEAAPSESSEGSDLHENPREGDPSESGSGNSEGPSDLSEGPGRKPGLNDEQLYFIGRRIFTELAPPKSLNGFINAMKAQGATASYERMAKTYEQLQAEFAEQGA
ncbi:hypothetical protein [Streptomyces kanamyceticus]|uniref:DUF2637 domain-containing protein n=1 Tax=Streptomyces kanamyceticus TaxID=1967 RepID=A0A5J6GIC0_STRKN|nr:hypothetical protein [Streptomyces kanamyceticus]QEU92866.1 hypothetical protein CP970_19855 [Streptomyces kanamyceticus]